MSRSLVRHDQLLVDSAIRDDEPMTGITDRSRRLLLSRPPISQAFEKHRCTRRAPGRVDDQISIQSCG